MKRGKSEYQMGSSIWKEGNQYVKWVVVVYGKRDRIMQWVEVYGKKEITISNGQ